MSDSEISEVTAIAQHNSHDNNRDHKDHDTDNDGVDDRSVSVYEADDDVDVDDEAISNNPMSSLQLTPSPEMLVRQNVPAYMMSDKERATDHNSRSVSHDEEEEEEGVIGADAVAATAGAAATSDLLVPRPSTNPDDPLNWSWWKKHAVLLALIPGCLLTDWTLTWGTTVFQAQAPEWGMSVEEVSHSVSPGIFMQGPGGLLAVPLCERYGRLPVLFYSQLLSLASTIGAAYAHGYASFTACRTLQGFFGAPPQVIGLSIIHDMFFFHERTRKINIWAASFLVGPYLGPLISSLLLLRIGWRDDFLVLAGFYGLSLVMVMVLGDETLFGPRQGMEMRGVGAEVHGKRRGFELGRHVRLLTGVEGWRNAYERPTLWEVSKNLGELLLRPYLLLPTALFIMPITMWTIGMVATISQFVLPPVQAGGYGFSLVALAMLYFAPILGTMAAEAWGHWFNDFLAKRHMVRYGFECRLTAVYPAVIIGAAGLVLFGQTLANHLSWVGLAFGWAMLCFCTLANMTAVSAYLLDCLPRHAALTGAWLNFGRVVGGFSVAYFQMPWIHRNGPAFSFGFQGVVVVGATLIIVATQVWGRKWRARFPAPGGGEVVE